MSSRTGRGKRGLGNVLITEHGFKDEGEFSEQVWGGVSGQREGQGRPSA